MVTDGRWLMVDGLMWHRIMVSIKLFVNARLICAGGWKHLNKDI